MKLVVMRKGGGGSVAINPDLVTHIRSANGAFTDVFFDGHQVAVEGSFQDVVRTLSVPDRSQSVPAPHLGEGGLARGPQERTFSEY